MSISSILSLITIILVVAIIVLALTYLSMYNKEKKSEKPKKGETHENSNVKIAKSYTTESIFNFMEFDKIEDNMIIQKNGKRFLMVIECQGINYDLMSELEKTSVESGFIQFLNALREPIQVYVQTRTINLEDSLKGYKERLTKIENDLNAKEAKYKAMLEDGQYTQKQLDKQKFEVARQKNLYDYGRDVIFNTERMSLNKNVLRKKYYIILSYYYNETENVSESEMKETAFSDLYTRCQSTVRVLGLSGVNGKVLDSYELVDLLYNAYNRSEAENFGLERAINAGYDNLYVTAPDILEKKMKVLDETIKENALNLAEKSIKYADEKLKQEIDDIEENLEDLIIEFAGELVEDNAEFLDDEVVKIAKKKIKETTKEESENVKETKTRKRTNAKK